MTNEEKRAAIENLLRALPDVVSPMQIARTLHQSKNFIYELLKKGKIKSYIYSGKYLIAKLDLIDYILTRDGGGKHFKVGDRHNGK